MRGVGLPQVAMHSQLPRVAVSNDLMHCDILSNWYKRVHHISIPVHKLIGKFVISTLTMVRNMSGSSNVIAQYCGPYLLTFPIITMHSPLSY